MRLALALLFVSACSDTADRSYDAGVICGDGGEGYFRRADAVGCNVVHGNLDLGDDVGDNVDDLSALHEVTGRLNIFRGNFTNLDGLGNLERVGADLSIHRTDKLASLSGLRSLRYVGGKLFLALNALLPQSEVEAFAASLEVRGEVQTELEDDP